MAELQVGKKCSNPGVDGKTINVGVSYPQTGAQAALASQYGAGVKAAFDWQNANDKVNGYKLKTIEANADTAQTSLTAVQALVENEDVFGIINGSSTAAPMYPYLRQNNIPVVSATGTDPATATDPNAFTATGVFAADYVNTAVPQLLKDKKAKNVALFALNVPIAVATATASQQALEDLGIKVGYTNFNVPATSYDATSDALAMKQAGVDAVVSFTPGQPSLSIATAVHQQGLEPKVMELTQMYDEALLGNEATEGVLTGITTVPFLGDIETLPPGGRLLRNAAEKYTPGEKVTQFYAYGFSAGLIFARGLKLAGKCPTRDAFITKLRKVKNYTAEDTLASPVTFAPTKISQNGDPFACYWFVLNDGTSFVSDPEPTCGKFVKTG